MILDLRTNGVLSIDHARLITELESEVRKEYNAFTEALCDANDIQNLDWFYRVTSRNTYVSSIFDKMCRLALLEKILEQKGTVQKILINSIELRVPCEQIIKKFHLVDPIAIECKDEMYKSNPVFGFIKCVSYFLLMISAKFFFPPKARPKGDITYIDTFIDASTFKDNKEYNDKYFPNLLTHKSTIQIKDVWLVPVISGLKSIKQFWQVYRGIRASKENFLLMEHYLKISDYLKAFKMALFQKPLAKNPHWRGVDISEIVQNEHKNDFCNVTLLLTVLRYYFFKRLADSNCNLKLVINNNENQIIDRAIILGTRKNFPATKINGYQGFVVAPYYATMFPQSFEHKAGLLPDKFFVMGEGLVERLKKDCPELNIGVAPAYRFRALHEIERKQKADEILLAVLPYHIEPAIDILSLCLELQTSSELKYEIMIKIHPDFTSEQLEKMLPKNLQKQFKYTNEVTPCLLARVKWLISAASTVCVEGALLGVHTVVVGGRSGPTQNPLVGMISKDRWSLCYTVEDLKEALKENKTFTPLNIEDYFSKLTKKNENILFDK
jgi:hypothetical protein